MYSDAFIVMPSDKKDNGLRGNLVYANVDPAVTNSIGNGWRIGTCVTPNYPYSLKVFEPADQFKGDFARNYFYMATCYENQIASWQTIDPNGNTILDGTSDKVFEQWYLEMLYSWHLADPVSTKEIDRNNAIYVVQGNRNPYIDHPEYVQMIWGGALSTAEYPTLSNAMVFPNPSTDGTLTITCETPLEEINLTSVNGQILQKITRPVFQNNTYHLGNLGQGFYFLQLKGARESVVKKVVLN